MIRDRADTLAVERRLEARLRDCFRRLGVPLREREHGVTCVVSYHYDDETGERDMRFIFSIEELARLLADA